MGKLLLTSVVSQSLKLGWMSSVSERVCMISSQNSRQRWQFCSINQCPFRMASVIIFLAISSWPCPMARDRHSWHLSLAMVSI